MKSIALFMTGFFAMIVSFVTATLFCGLTVGIWTLLELPTPLIFISTHVSPIILLAIYLFCKKIAAVVNKSEEK